MFTVFIKLYISDKCNKDWLTSNAPQHSKAVKELKQLAQEFDRNLHFAVIPSSTVERGESFVAYVQLDKYGKHDLLLCSVFCFCGRWRTELQSA